MGQIGWDTPPTEEELDGTIDWSTPPTEEEINSVKPQYVKDTPVMPEEDEFASSIDMQPEGTVRSEETENATMTQPEMQQQQMEQYIQKEEDDIETTLAEIQQSVATMGDTMGATDNSEKNMAKYNKEATRVLKEKGYKVYVFTKDNSPIGSFFFEEEIESVPGGGVVEVAD